MDESIYAKQRLVYEAAKAQSSDIFLLKPDGSKANGIDLVMSNELLLGVMNYNTAKNVDHDAVIGDHEDSINSINLQVSKNTSFNTTVSTSIIFIENYPLLDSDNGDDSLRIQRAINACASLGGGIVQASHGKTYVMKSTVNIPICVIFDGQNASFQTSTSASYKNNYMFTLNSNDATTWDSKYNARGVIIQNMSLTNTSQSTSIKGILCASTAAKIKNITGWNMPCIVYKYTGDYLDQVEIDTITSLMPLGTGYAVNMGWLGDGIRITNVHSPGGKSIYLHCCLGAVIDRCLNGDIFIDTCEAISLTALHMETGVITIKDSQVSISDVIQFIDQGNLKILNSDYGHTSRVSIKNYNFLYRLQADLSSMPYDIELDPGSIVTLDNCARIHFDQGNAGSTEQYGISIKYNSVDLSAFNTFSGLLSTRSEIFAGGLIQFNKTYKFTGGTINYLYFVNTSTGGHPGYAVGTYHFALNILIDNVRMIGYADSQGDISATVSTAGNDIRLSLGGNEPKHRMLRLYRGSTANTYTSYCDVPLMSAVLLTDHYTNICGYTWKTRTTSATARDAVNFYYKTTYSNNNVTCYGAAIPTVGTWTALDRIVNSTIAVGNVKGWICSVSGTHGTLNGGSTTGSITSGSTSLTVSSANDLVVGQYITITGVTGSKQVTAINGTTITIDSSASATVTSAVVAFSAPTWVSEGTY